MRPIEKRILLFPPQCFLADYKHRPMLFCDFHFAELFEKFRFLAGRDLCTRWLISPESECVCPLIQLWHQVI
jgi:hypothetical protein